MFILLPIAHFAKQNPVSIILTPRSYSSSKAIFSGNSLSSVCLIHLIKFANKFSHKTGLSWAWVFVLFFFLLN